MAIHYEWDVVVFELDGSDMGDIVDHNFVESFKEAILRKRELDADPEPGMGYKVVLVRNNESMTGEHSWAYLNDDNKIDECFEDAYNRETAKVPKRYLKEIEKFFSK